MVPKMGFMETTKRFAELLATFPEPSDRDDLYSYWELEPDYPRPVVWRPEDLRPDERWASYVTQDKVADTVAKIERIARKCEKHNLPAPTIHTAVHDDNLCHVFIAGLNVKLPGWTVVASVDHATDGIVTLAPGAPEDTFAKWNNAPNRCDECGKTINRNKTVIIRDEDGNEKQVGGKCVSLYLGMGAEVATTLVREMDEFDRGYDYADERTPDTVAVQRVLAWSLAVTRVFGWVSRAKAREEGGSTTGERVTRCLLDWSEAGDRFRRQVLESYDLDSEKHMETMRRINEWAATAGGSDYLDSIAHIVRECEAVHVKRIGLLASAPQAWNRDEQKRLEREAAGPVADVPVTDERMLVTGQVMSVKVVETDFGASVKMLVQADDGYRLWGTNPRDEFQQGDRVEFMARVEPSRDDSTFGFFSRPTKARVLA